MNELTTDHNQERNYAPDHDCGCGSRCGHDHNHGHESPHEHGKDCECGHDHGHHHHHEHGEDCGCGHDRQGHHHSEAEEIIENALVISKKGSLDFSERSADEALDIISGKIIGIAKELAVGDAVLGHVKALLSCDGGKATISITNISSPTVKKHEGWDGSKRITSGELSANILSLVNTDVSAEKMLDEILTA